MLSSKITVAIPENGIIVRRTGKYKYVYKVLETYRNKKGQPTNKRKLIGRLDHTGQRLVPNDNYYELYEPELSLDALVESGNASVVSVGVPFVVTSIFTRLNVAKILKNVFGVRRAMNIITAVAYMVSKGNVFEHVTYWCEDSIINGANLTPQKSSALFASITYEERMTFFKEWIAAVSPQGYLAYDVTSFSSYAEGIIELEWGYNRDGDKLPQINLGCYLSQELNLPMFYVTYPGSIVDKSHFSYMMAYNKDLGLSKDIVFVMDRGFCSTVNINYMHSEGIHYIMGVNLRTKATEAAIDNVREKIVVLRNMAGKGIYALSEHGRYYGEASTIHVYNSPELGERQRADLLRTVEDMETRLKQYKTLQDKEFKYFSRFFDIELNESISFTRNYDKIDEAAKNCGFFCILTNTNLSSAEVLKIYKEKDVIEKGFDDIKNHIDMKRLRVHSDATVAGKLFCAFLALIITSEMTNCLQKYNSSNDKRTLSKRGLINELEKLRIIGSSSKWRLINPLSKTQRDLLDLLDINDYDFVKFTASNS